MFSVGDTYYCSRLNANTNNIDTYELIITDVWKETVRFAPTKYLDKCYFISKEKENDNVIPIYPDWEDGEDEREMAVISVDYNTSRNRLKEEILNWVNEQMEYLNELKNNISGD